jgi:hypothetical protein
MRPPAISALAPAPFWRRAFDWWLAQLKHVLPPTIFFFVGFNLILWTKRQILEEQGIEFSGFLTATLAALLVGKAVLVTDNLPFMHRFDGSPMIQAHLVQERSVLVLRTDRTTSRRAHPFPHCRRRDLRFSGPPSGALLLGTFLVDTGLVDGAVPCLRHHA